MPNIFLANSLNTSLKIHDDGLINYWFFHKPSYPGDYPEIYQTILSWATTDVEIWDPYFNVGKNEQEIFNLVNSNISIKILAISGLNGSDAYFQNVAADLRLVIPRSKNVRFAMRAIDKSDMAQNAWLFHDRILILDKSEVYLIGCSLGGHVTGHLSTGIYKVTDLDTTAFIISIFQEYWRNATNNEYTLRFLHP